MPTNYVVVVDGKAYGPFYDTSVALEWLHREFPVAYAQERYQVCELVEI